MGVQGVKHQSIRVNVNQLYLAGRLIEYFTHKHVGLIIKMFVVSRVLASNSWRNGLVKQSLIHHRSGYKWANMGLPAKTFFKGYLRLAMSVSIYPFLEVVLNCFSGIAVTWADFKISFLGSGTLHSQLFLWSHLTLRWLLLYIQESIWIHKVSQDLSQRQTGNWPGIY